MRLYTAVCTDCGHRGKRYRQKARAAQAASEHQCPPTQHPRPAPVTDPQAVIRIAHWAARDYQKRNPAASYDEVLSDAMLGVAQAVTRWDPSKGTLGTYAAPRARGAILDGVRSRGTLARSEYRAGVRFDTLPEHRRPALSLQSLHDTGQDVPHNPSDFTDVDDRDTIDRLLAPLDARSRYIIEAHDLHGYRLAEIAATLGITESRVCQLRTKALDRVRAGHQPAALRIDLTTALPRQREGA